MFRQQSRLHTRPAATRGIKQSSQQPRANYWQHYVATVWGGESDRGCANGEGFYEPANNRRLEMQIRFLF